MPTYILTVKSAYYKYIDCQVRTLSTYILTFQIAYYKYVDCQVRKFSVCQVGTSTLTKYGLSSLHIINMRIVKSDKSAHYQCADCQVRQVCTQNADCQVCTLTKCGLSSLHIINMRIVKSANYPYADCQVCTLSICGLSSDLHIITMLTATYCIPVNQKYVFLQ